MHDFVLITLKIVNKTLNLFIYLATIPFLISKKTTKFNECQIPRDKNLRDFLVSHHPGKVKYINVHKFA